MSSEFIHVIACARPSVLFKADIPLYVCTAFCLLIHLMMYTRAASTFRLLQIMLLKNRVMHIPLWVPAFNYFGYLLQAELLDEMVGLFLICRGAAVLFSVDTKPLTQCPPATPLAPLSMSLGRAHSSMSLISTAMGGEVGIRETTFLGPIQRGSPWKQTLREPTTQGSLSVSQEALSSPWAPPGMNRTFWKSTLWG